MKRPMVLGIAGGSGSGKTTIVRKLVEYCDKTSIQVLQLDHYYKDLAHLDPKDRDSVNFDHPDALEMDLLGEHLKLLAAGEPINRPTYEFASHTRSSKVETLAPKEVILVDGIFALYSPLVREHLDCGIYVDVADDVRFIRRLKRDVSERGRSIDGVIQQYLETVKPMHDRFVAPTKLLADMVVYWNTFNPRTIQLIGNLIRHGVESN
jgi:uridine kinase